MDDISGHVAGSPKMVQAITTEAARLWVEGVQARDLPLFKDQSKVLIDGPDKLKQGLLRQLEEQGIDETDSARNIGADLQLGKRRRAGVVKGRIARAARRSRRARQLRKAGAHTCNLTLTGSNAGVLWGSEVLGFTPTQLRAIRADASEATCRLSRGQNVATTMLAHAQATGQRTSTRRFGITAKWCWRGRRESGKARQISTRCRLRCVDRSARLSRLKRPLSAATDAAATFVLTLLRLGWSAQSARHLTTHSGTKIDLMAVAPKTVGFWVDQASFFVVR